MVNPDFSGNGFTCVDIDECGMDNECSQFASCTNVAGGYDCNCKAGFSGDGFTCTDVVLIQSILKLEHRSLDMKIFI